METTLAVETPETSLVASVAVEGAVTEPADAPDFGHFGNEQEIVALEVGVEDRLFNAAPEYLNFVDQAAKRAADAKRIRECMAYDFALYKAIKVGRGRDGEWGPFILKLGLVVRTVDRWVANKLASGQLPEWAATKLRANQQPVPPPPPPEKQPLELLLVGLSDEQKTQFNEAMDKFVPEAFALLIFETVTTHPVALAPKVLGRLPGPTTGRRLTPPPSSENWSRERRKERRREDPTCGRPVRTKRGAAGVFTIPAA